MGACHSTDTVSAHPPHTAWVTPNLCTGGQGQGQADSSAHPAVYREASAHATAQTPAACLPAWLCTRTVSAAGTGDSNAQGAGQTTQRQSGWQKLSPLPLTRPCSQAGASQSNPAPDHRVGGTCHSHLSLLPFHSPASPEVVTGELLQRIGLGPHLGLCCPQLQEPDDVLPLVRGHGDQGLGAERRAVYWDHWDLMAKPGAS